MYIYVYFERCFLRIYTTDLPPVSLESVNNLCRKSDTIRGSPSRRDTEGCHPRSSLAFEMSGFLLCGSSSVFGLNSIFAFGSMVSCTTWASSSIVNSPGFPRLKGPTCSPSISRIKPSTKSDTYWKLLVCFPSP